MKALNNYVSAAGMVAACEALKVGADFGIAPDRIIAVLNASTGKNNSAEINSSASLQRFLNLERTK
jgi:3-hydroxyisobutyrate dehydrogenase